MKEPYKFSGKKTPEKIQRGKEYLDKKQQEGSTPVDGEQPKSLEQIETLQNVLRAIREALAEFGVADPNLPTLEQIHLLTDGAFKAQTGSSVFQASHSSRLNAIYINLEKTNESEFIHTIIHETIHFLSKHKFYLTETYSPIESKSGYQYFNSNTEQDEHFHFTGLNEAVTEQITKDIVAKIYKKTTDEEEKPDGIPIYDYYIKIINEIAKSIAKTRGETAEDVWKQLKQEIFTGNMMHLREVDKVFGKGSLRVLAAMGTDSFHPALSMNEILGLLYNYFHESTTPERRHKIALHILNEREREAYEKITKTESS